MSVSLALQTLIYQTLVADPGVHSLIADRVFDQRPTKLEDSSFPCVTFGPTQEIEDDEECIDGEEHFFQIDVWDRSQGRLRNAKIISDAVKSALHRRDMNMPDPNALISIEVTQKRVMQDQDGVTAHGIITVRAQVEI